MMITIIFMVMFIGSVDMHKTATNDFVEAVWALCAIVSFIGATNYIKQDNCCFFKE
jgi:predicted branched-subunit amino acid permease